MGEIIGYFHPCIGKIIGYFHPCTGKIIGYLKNIYIFAAKILLNHETKLI